MFTERNIQRRKVGISVLCLRNTPMSAAIRVAQTSGTEDKQLSWNEGTAHENCTIRYLAVICWLEYQEEINCNSKHCSIIYPLSLVGGLSHLHVAAVTITWRAEEGRPQAFPGRTRHHSSITVVRRSSSIQARMWPLFFDYTPARNNRQKPP